MRFEWDDGNVEHIARHLILPEEVEEVLANAPVDLGAYIRNGEERLNHIGRTNAGRFLVVVTTQRGTFARVVTAYPANQELRTLYAEERGADDAGIS
jgi:uncharacterized protein